MPVYRYRCRSCGYQFGTLILPGLKKPEPTCPHCEGGDLEETVERPEQEGEHPFGCPCCGA